MTQEREKRPVKMDENHTLMAKTKDRRQNLKVFVFLRKKTAGRLREACHQAAIFMNGRINARLCGKPYGQSATP